MTPPSPQPRPNHLAPGSLPRSSSVSLPSEWRRRRVGRRVFIDSPGGSGGAAVRETSAVCCWRSSLLPAHRGKRRELVNWENIFSVFCFVLAGHNFFGRLLNLDRCRVWQNATIASAHYFILVLQSAWSSRTVGHTNWNSGAAFVIISCRRKSDSETFWGTNRGEQTTCWRGIWKMSLFGMSQSHVGNITDMILWQCYPALQNTVKYISVIVIWSHQFRTQTTTTQHTKTTGQQYVLFHTKIWKIKGS